MHVQANTQEELPVNTIIGKYIASYGPKCLRHNMNSGIVVKTPEVMLNLYKTLVRPHLEYCISAWSPHYQKDKKLLEKVQHRFTQMITSLNSLQYEARLQKTVLWTLEERRNRADLIEVFKIAHGFSAIPFTDFRLIQQEEPGDIHWSWLNVGATRILESISSLIEWCPSGICWIMILWWQRQLMVSRLNWNGNGQRRRVRFWTDVCWTSRP